MKVKQERQQTRRAGFIVMNGTVEARKARGVCIWCEGKLDGNSTRCINCRQKHAKAARESAKARGTYRHIRLEADLDKSPYAGTRPCSQQLSERCKKVFMSPDRRSVTCCEPCREVQLRQDD